ECRKRLAPCDSRQILALQLGAAGERHGSAAQPLHGECEIRETIVIGERFAHEADRARIELGQRTAVPGAHAIASDAGIAETRDEPAAPRIDLGAALAV